jgi:hypothetical protein
MLQIFSSGQINLCTLSIFTLFSAVSIKKHRFYSGLPLFLVPVVMRVHRIHSPCLVQGGAQRSLAQDIGSQTLPWSYTQGYYAVGNYNPSASDQQHISPHQYAGTIPCSKTYP